MIVASHPTPRAEQTRARYPDDSGYVERDGVRVWWERYGAGERTIMLLPTWSLVHSRIWRAQIAYLARHARVVTFDGRGSGRSDRPPGAEGYAVDEFVADTLAVMDASGTVSATLVTVSCGALWATVLAADFPDRVDSVVYIGPAVGLTPGHPERERYGFEEHYDPDETGWALYNRHAWLRDYPAFLEFFLAQCFNEPHSTKAIEDGIGWGLETGPEVLIDATLGMALQRDERFADVCARVRCPTLVIHGDRDLVRPLAQGEALAAATGGRLTALAGSGHLPQLRDPVRVNLIVRDLVCPPRPPSQWRRAASRSRRALYISSPIGLGHVRRDLAIARELRRLEPRLELDWLAQEPVTSVLAAAGERIHPLSTKLASESGHWQAEASSNAGDHSLHCFEALRRMDEILLANFMVFHDAVRSEQYDLWIGDEAWDVDHFLHENPELKTAAYAWLTDFVGYLPMPGGGEREASLTADYNAEMIEQIARYPRVRDCAIFVGDPEDVVPDRFGPGLPSIRDWTTEHFSFAGYVTGFETAALSDRAALREALGYRPGDQVCVVTVGGSGVGQALLRRVIDSFPLAKERVPGLRMIVVAGPRIAIDDLGRAASAVDARGGLELHEFVPDLYRHLAACDLAIIQGGLATAMELTANGRPFLYFPLANHFEQNFHVHHRLARHRAGRRMDFECSPPAAIAGAIAAEIGREVDYLPVAADGAARAAAIIAELL
jgi:pimeloyl-ACP methyl ester carboxylesterase/predicted glycosyltransferase